VKQSFYRFLALAAFGAMFFGATVSHIETRGLDVFGILGSFLMGAGGIIGCVLEYRDALKAAQR
jgi:hypothetical protein